MFRRLLHPRSVATVAGVTLAVKIRNADCSPWWWPIPVNYKALRADIEKLIDADEERRNDGTSIAPVSAAWLLANLAPHVFSLARHSSDLRGTAQEPIPPSTRLVVAMARPCDLSPSRTGEVRYSALSLFECPCSVANAGLHVARNLLEPLKRKHGCSYADLYTLSGVVAVEKMGGPVIPWRAGREDSSSPTQVPDGRLPDADKGNSSATRQHIRDIFHRMGFNDREIVALCGAHAVGRCHTDRSGYWGPWSRAETTFSNEYFRLLVEEKWTPKKTHGGKKWEGPMQYESKDGTLMMLPSDMALVEDPEFKKYVQIYAKDENVFFTDFAAAFSKLLELGVPSLQPQAK